MTYNEATSYLYSLIPRNGRSGGSKPVRMRALLEKLDNPHKGLKLVHIAGTSGKGSTVVFLSSILTESFYKTGRYTSPHVENIRERISVGTVKISKPAFRYYVEKVKTTVENIEAEALKSGIISKRGVTPTYFEALFAIALMYFQDQEVDVAVIETGIGGKNDATSVIDPVLCVITSIGFDHIGSLGSSLEKIAYHKAGIITSGVPVVSGVKNEIAKRVINCQAKSGNSVITNIEDDFGCTLQSTYLNKTVFNFWTRTKRSLRFMYNVGLAGIFQAHNATVAVESLLVLRVNGFKKITQESIRGGLCSATIPGRMEVVDYNPLTILDVAHSVPKIKALIESLQYIQSSWLVNKKWVVVVACAQKTKYKQIVTLLSKVSTHIIVTEFDANGGARIARLVGSYDLRREPYYSQVEFDPDPKHALEKARSYEQPILITGSLYFVSAVRPLFAQAEV